MAILQSEILWKLSVATGSAGDSTAQADPNASLGKYVSTTAITDAGANNLFADASGDDNAASAVHYRCIFIHNNNATLTWSNVKIWINTQATGSTIAIATDNIGPVPKGQAGAQAEEEADEDTAPTAVSAFSSATSKATGLSVGNLDAGDVAAIWVRRTLDQAGATDNDSWTLEVEGDTPA